MKLTKIKYSFCNPLGNANKSCPSDAPFVVLTGSPGPSHPRQAICAPARTGFFTSRHAFLSQVAFRVKKLLTCISTSAEFPLGSGPTSSFETPSLVPSLAHWPSCVETEQIVQSLWRAASWRKCHGLTSQDSGTSRTFLDISEGARRRERKNSTVHTRITRKSEENGLSFQVSSTAKAMSERGDDKQRRNHRLSIKKTLIEIIVSQHHVIHSPKLEQWI